MSAWQKMLDTLKRPSNETEITIVGKYVDLTDAYKSINEALLHGGVANDCGVRVRWVEAEDIVEQGPDGLLASAKGILVPGGFGERGIEGKIRAVRYARENGVPFLGICLGMQCAVIEYARNVCGLENANSSEFDADTPHPVIDLLPEQKDVDRMGGTMRLGAYPCDLADGTFAAAAYGKAKIEERHRHRYEFNNEYMDQLTGKGLRIAGTCTGRDLVEIVEIPDHPWFLGCQFHPEFKSRPLAPHPLFAAFVGAALDQGRS
jgi:CTP synthase